jgi:hypothetical protein
MKHQKEIYQRSIKISSHQHTKYYDTLLSQTSPLIKDFKFLKIYNMIDKNPINFKK